MKLKNKYIIFGSIAIFSILLIAFSVYAFNKHKSDQKEVNIVENIDDFPKLENIDPNKNPMLYDFLNSSISYKMSVDPSNWGFYYAILQNQNKPNNIYVEYYTHGESLTFPSLGSEIVKIKLNKDEQNAVHDFSKKLSKDRVIKEGNWNLYIVSQWNDLQDSEFNYCDKIGRWAGIDLKNSFKEFKYGKMEKTINSGLGWPTEWLRKKPYNETVKLEGYNPNDPFWDKYNINSYKIYTKDNGDELKVTVAQLDRFKFKIGSNEVNLNEKQLNEYLKSEGWI